jgi:hypothetical protein
MIEMETKEWSNKKYTTFNLGERVLCTGLRKIGEIKSNTHNVMYLVLIDGEFSPVLIHYRDLILIKDKSEKEAIKEYDEEMNKIFAQKKDRTNRLKSKK